MFTADFYRAIHDMWSGFFNLRPFLAVFSLKLAPGARIKTRLLAKIFNLIFNKLAGEKVKN